MQRTVSIALVGLALAFGVIGCGGDGTTGGDTTTTTEETTTEETTTEETTTEETTTTEAADGRQIFVSRCGSCHVLASAGTSGAVGPNLDDVAPSADRVADQVRSGGGAMPSFEGVLTDAEIDAVAAYVADNAGG